MSQKIRRVTGLVISAVLVTIALSVSTGCDFLGFRQALNYGPGETVTFANGYEFVIPQGWHGMIKLDADDGDPEDYPLRLYGPLGQEGRLYINESSQDTKDDIAADRASIAQGYAGRMGLAHYNDARIDMIITAAEEGTQHYDLDLYIRAKGGDLCVYLYDDPVVNKAIKAGVDNDELAKIAIEEIGLQIPGE